MKTTLLKYLMMMCALLIVSWLPAQETSIKKGTLELAFGFNTFGPAPQMGKLMKTYHFDQTTDNWLFGGVTEHPHYDPVGFTGALSYSYSTSEKNQIGLRASYATLREVSGSSEVGGLMFVRFSNFSLIPFYTRHLNKSLDLLAGPALMVNTGDKTSDYGESPDSYTKFSPGVLAGLNLNIWNQRVTSGKLGVNYLLTLPNKMGPFSAQTYTSVASIPESKIGFSHLSICFIIGVHL